MSIYFRKFLIKNTIATFAIFLLGAILFSTLFPEYYHPFFIILVLIASFVNLAAFYIATNTKGEKDKSLQIVIKSFAIKFFSYLIMALIFLLLVKISELKITFVIILFSLYMIFTALELTSLLKFFKTERK